MLSLIIVFLSHISYFIFLKIEFAFHCLIIIIDFKVLLFWCLIILFFHSFVLVQLSIAPQFQFINLNLFHSIIIFLNDISLFPLLSFHYYLQVDLIVLIFCNLIALFIHLFIPNQINAFLLYISLFNLVLYHNFQVYF